MKIAKRTAVADMVLRELAKLTGPVCYATPYINGREHGWTVFPNGSQAWDAPAGVTFSEFRRSDEIVLYCGTNPYAGNPHFGGGFPGTERAYEAKQFFKPRDYKGAALAAAKFLREQGGK